MSNSFRSIHNEQQTISRATRDQVRRSLQAIVIQVTDRKREQSYIPAHGHVYVYSNSNHHSFLSSFYNGL